MVPKELNDWLQVLGLFAVLGGLVFVGLQMRQTQELAFAERAQNRATNAIEISSAITAHPEVWTRGISGEELDETDAVMFEMLMQAWNDYYFFAAEGASRLGYDSARNYWATTYGVFLYRNPGARQWWENHQSEVMDTPRLSTGPVDLTSSIEWHDRIKSVWGEIERTGDLGSSTK